MMKQLLKYIAFVLFFLLILVPGTGDAAISGKDARTEASLLESTISVREIQDCSNITLRKFVLPDNGCLRESVPNPVLLQVRTADRENVSSGSFVQSSQDIHYKMRRAAVFALQAQLHTNGHYLYALCRLII